MSKQVVNVTIAVPEKELTMLRETLRLNQHLQKDLVRFIENTALNGAISYASSTVNVSEWKHLQDLAGKLGVENPI